MTTSTASIRLLRPGDMAAVIEIDARASGNPRPDYLKGKARGALEGELGMVISLVAEQDGKVVGFLMGELWRGEFGIPETIATVDTVGVHPSAQGKGVARSLMEEFVTHARKAGVERIRTIVGWNQWTLLRFFRSTGFAPGRSIVLEREV